MHPARKFSHNNCKTKTLPSDNKENDKISMTESFAKKFSLGTHIISNESDPFQHKKSIADEKISVFLEQSQNHTFVFEKPNSDSQIKYLNRMIQNDAGSILSVLSQGLNRGDFKSGDVKNLVETLVQKLAEEQKSESSSLDDSFRMSDHIMRPYLEQEITLMQENLSKLKKRQKDITDVKSLSQADKNYLKKNLKQMFELQRKELEAGC